MKKGFTLIELLVVISIIAILTAIGVASYSSVNQRSRDAKRKSDIEQVRSALELYRTDNSSYPGSSVAFIVLSSLDPGDGTGPLVTKYMPSLPVGPQNTAQTPDVYYYSPLAPLGTPTKYYGYCICAGLEESSLTSNTCGAGVTPPPALTNYYCEKNP
jgi:type II secretion system protein G